MWLTMIALVYIVVMIIMFAIHYCMQSQYSTLQRFNQAPEFFSESDRDYWEPASDTKGLYEQLSSKKYREILRNQIQYVTYNI